MKLLRIPFLLFATTASHGFLQEASGQTPLKSLWTLDGKPFAEPTRPDPLVNFVGATASGQLVFSVAGTYRDMEAETEMVVVKGRSGEVVKRAVLPMPSTTANRWIPGTVAAGGEQVIVCMVQWREDEEKKRRASMILTRFDAGAGTFPATKTLSFSDPAQSGESGPVSWPGSQCVHFHADGKRILMASPYFTAVLDAITLDVLQSRILPPELKVATPVFHAKGIKWSLIMKDSNKYWNAENGGEPVEIGKDSYDALPAVNGVKAAARVNKEGKFLEVAKSKEGPWSQVEAVMPAEVQWVRPEFSTGKVCLVKIVANPSFHVAVPLE